ncbi:hypothetical protein [Mesorhizobium sp.]|uniref:hypothetical protein n=1 Tax=Mesorhizobium sp. TaxID=1871066 RepID=UPI0012226F72|nr:hypothetical protein [Mesorhizobium sp.]TJV15861.1 MAG: hypothetical protein E5Y07_19505 [Mesorhizobium sp.]
MLGYRKRAFTRAHSLLRSIQADQSNFAALGQLQGLLIKEIILAEERIRLLKAEQKLLKSNGNNRRIRRLDQRIENTRHLMFLWRCFGDGIAFTYIDKYALKQTFYRTDRYLEKQAAGFLSGKDGLAHELGLLLSALDHGVPAVLTDLTNTIRHGDLCLLGASDPVLMEVKSSASGGARSRRQKTSLKALHNFLETDRADTFRGVPNVMRQEQVGTELDYAGQINDCISDAIETGFATRQPEPGLQYIVARTKDGDPQKIINSVTMDEPWVFALNAARIDRSWAPYSPFTLTIQTIENLWAFVRGDVYVMVAVSIPYLEKVATDMGFSASFDRDDHFYPLKVDGGPTGGVQRLSTDFLSRVGFEFVSPKSLIIRSVDSFQRAAQEQGKSLGALVAPKFLDPKMAELAEKYALDAGINVLAVPNSSIEPVERGDD